jgi:hypothetical protein
MNRIKTIVMAALALVVMFAGQTAAQTVPTLSVSAGPPNGVGATVTIEWSGLPLAQGYTLEAGTTPGVANIATVNLPASVTRVVVFAPNGTYYVRVRGFAGALTGDFSPVQAVTVGGPVTCGTLVAPTVAAANSSYLSVKVDWTPVAGAVGYMVEYSRINGTTELAEPAGPTVNSVTKYAGFTGNFFVRVVAHNSCGETAASGYVPFSITNSPGSGPRTPDPAPGTLIPRASLGYALGVIQQVAGQYPGALQNSCVEHGGNNEFLFRVVQRLRAIDSRWGLNNKRGHQGMSQDVISYNPTDRQDLGEPQVYLWDIISGHCGSGRADVWFNDITDVTWFGGGRDICEPQGRPDYGGTWCARWMIEPYIRAGFPPDPRQ